MDDFKKNIDNLSFDDDLFNNNVFNKYKRKRKKTKDFDMDRSMNNLEFTCIGNKSVINAKTIELCDDYIVKSDFERPHSILNNIIKYEEDQAFSKSQIRFNLQKFLKTEAEKDNEFLNKDRRKSFLGFLEYAQFHNEINELNELIENESSNNEIEDNEAIDNKDKKYDMLFLNEDSYLSRSNNITLEDIEILPMHLNEQKIYKNEYLIHDNIKKNVDSNKLTQKIRAEVFDRKSINTNINLKTNEMKKFYEEANKKLDEQLYVNKKKIRIRKDMDLNVSGIIKKKNYNKTLKEIEKDEQDLNDENEFDKKDKEIKNNQNQNNINISGKITKRSLNEPEEINNDNKIHSNNKNTLDNLINETEKNSNLPFLNKQKTIRLLNAKIANDNNGVLKENDKKPTLRFNFASKSLNKTICLSQYNQANSNNIIDNSQIIKNSTINNKKQKNLKTCYFPRIKNYIKNYKN